MPLKRLFLIHLSLAGSFIFGCSSGGDSTTDTNTDTDTSADTDADVGTDTGTASTLHHVMPVSYENALRNPLKGFTTNGVETHEWATLAHVYIKWNELENDVSDGIEKIINVSNEKFKGVEERNVKVIPRVYLHWSGDEKYWPEDMTTDDYSSMDFQGRVIRLIERLGKVWNDDPRIAFIELGIFGKWGEHHSPSPDESMQKMVGEVFQKAFPDKQVSVRHVWDQFSGFGFGEYWDSFAHNDQMWPHGQSIALVNQSNDLYKTSYIGGETAYDWGSSETQPGSNPTDSVSDPAHRDFVINTIHWLHCTQLRWISGYDESNEEARAGAKLVQRALGYRFVLEDVGFLANVKNETMRVSLSVKNEGAAPFYYNWPIEVSLLDSNNRSVVWSATFDAADIRDWLPGEKWTEPEWSPTNDWSEYDVNAGWSTASLAWAVPPSTYEYDDTFHVNVPEGQYLLALAILDPAGMEPSLRFATSNYFTGGRHPVGVVAVGTGEGGSLPQDMVFDDPVMDETLKYTYTAN